MHTWLGLRSLWPSPFLQHLHWVPVNFCSTRNLRNFSGNVRKLLQLIFIKAFAACKKCQSQPKRLMGLICFAPCFLGQVEIWLE